MGKQKAPKVLADAVSWINTALTEFGITGLTLRSLIDFLKNVLGNSNAQVRTSATKTLVTVKMFAGPGKTHINEFNMISNKAAGIKDLLEDLNPQLLATIISEFDKVEGNSALEPTRKSADLINLPSASTGSGKDSGGSDPLDDLFPRVELDGLLKGTAILTDAKSDAWKTKKESLEALQAILDQGSNKRLKPGMGEFSHSFNHFFQNLCVLGEIGQVLKMRVVDTNKAVQSLALDIVSRIATGMGKPFEKQSRLFVASIVTVLADQKAHVRSAASQTLTAIATACGGLDSMVAGITTGLESQNPILKSTLLNWIVDWFKTHEPTSLDIAGWVPFTISSLDDRNGDVRKAAQALLPTLIKCSGFDFVMQQTNALKPASRATALPLIQAARPTGDDVVPSASIPAKPLKKPSPPSPDPSSAVAAAGTAAPLSAMAKAGNKIGTVRRKLPTASNSRPASRTDTLPEAKPSTTIKRSNVASTTPQPSGISGVPFITMNADAKRLRLAKDGIRWVNEGGPLKKDLVESLHSQMEPHASKELIARLFSHDHNAINDFIVGLSMMADFYSNASGVESTEAVGLANVDLPLKYVSVRIHESQSNLVTKCLGVVDTVTEFLQSINHQITDGEALCFIPTLVHKV
jgi:cytoskeleton-associated protein 5